MRPAPLRAAAALGAALLLVASACTGSSEHCPNNAQCTAPRTTASPSTTEWRRILHLQTDARQEVAVGVGELDGHPAAYVIGGLLASGRATDIVDFYQPPFWTGVPSPMPAKVHHTTAAVLKGRLYVLGGFTGDLGGPASRRVFVRDFFPGGEWSEAPPMPRPRGAAAAVAVGGKIIVVGGISNGKHVAPTEIFDGSSWHEGAEIPTPRDHLGAATDGKLVYVVGGRRGPRQFGTFEVYDPTADRWSSLPDIPTPRSGLGATFAKGSVIAAGGEGPRIFPEVEAFDVTTNRWRRLPDLRVPVHGLGLAALGDELYAFAGGTRVGLAPTRTCQFLKLI